MLDREKVIEELQEAAAYLRSSFDAMYGTAACEKYMEWTSAIELAIALLKALDVTPEELERLKKCRHECKIDCLLKEYDRVKEERDAMLKAQEPRLMTLEEAQNSQMIEYRSGNTRDVGAEVFSVGPEFYNVIWRVWTSRPTPEQMEAEPWRSL